jgi:hypothetical protein
MFAWCESAVRETAAGGTSVSADLPSRPRLSAATDDASLC